MRNFDVNPLFRSAIGFDRLASLLEATVDVGRQTDGYPPFNIEKLGDDEYRLSVAVAGFTRDELEIEVKDGTLAIRGKVKEPGEKTYLHRGIATRAFERRFQLADYVEVKAADLDNGLLVIDLVREVPEAMKPRKIEINAAAKVLEHAA